MIASEIPSSPPSSDGRCYTFGQLIECFRDQALAPNQTQKLGPYDTTVASPYHSVSHVTTANGHHVRITTDISNVEDPTVRIDDLTDGKNAVFGLGLDAEAGETEKRSGNLDVRLEKHGGDGETVTGDLHQTIVWGDRNTGKASEIKIGSPHLFSNHPAGQRSLQVAFDPSTGSDADDLRIDAGTVSFKPRQVEITHRHADQFGTEDRATSTTYSSSFNDLEDRLKAMAGDPARAASNYGELLNQHGALTKEEWKSNLDASLLNLGTSNTELLNKIGVTSEHALNVLGGERTYGFAADQNVGNAHVAYKTYLASGGKPGPAEFTAYVNDLGSDEGKMKFFMESAQGWYAESQGNPTNDGANNWSVFENHKLFGRWHVHGDPDNREEFLAQLKLGEVALPPRP